MRAWLIKFLGGYTEQGFLTTDEFIEHLTTLPVEEKHKVLTLAVKRLFNSVGQDDILRTNERGIWMIEGREMTQEEMEAVKKSAENFMNGKLWSILEKDIRYQANRRMFTDSKNEFDLIAGKLLLYSLDIIKTRLKRM